MLIFVYGTLKRGCQNHGLLEEQRFVREARTRPLYRLYDCGHYPCLVTASSGSGCSIRGEVWDVDDRTLRLLDRLEGVPTLYRREILQVYEFEEPMQGYLFQQDVAGFGDCGEAWP